MKDDGRMHGRANVTPVDRLPTDGTPTDGANTDNMRVQPDGLTGAGAAERLREAVDRRLSALVAGPQAVPIRLNRAVRHSLLAPGKRVRPLLVMLTAAEFGAEPAMALDAGCAVELVHTASLVLDDLPCMDDAHTRRGLPTAHEAFGEATAVLAAIAMLTRAFGVLASMEGVAEGVRLDTVTILAHASGADGLAAGQERDLNERGLGDGLPKIDAINHQKTGALFVAAAQMGGRVAGVDSVRMAALAALGTEVGLAFQTLDDVIDLSRSTSEAGKDTGKDSGKATVATVMGLDAARAEVRRHMAQAIAAIEPYTVPGGPLQTFVTAMFAEATRGAEAKIASHGS
jgi:geranylgeranyl diphosphate synthase, type II